jgi:hypothetical protein
VGIRLSHSSKNTWLTCGRKYELHYLLKLRSRIMSSALLFGSAVDNALNIMLSKKDEAGVLELAIHEFNRCWEQGDDFQRKPVDLPLNPNIKYYRNDYDHDLLDKPEWRELLKYDSKFFDTKNEVDALIKLKTPWEDIPEEKRMVYNYANWLCLQKKGHMLLTAYHKDILPKIKSVVAVQTKVELDDGEGNILNGVVDYIAIIDGKQFGFDYDPVTLLDNKTSSEEYDSDSVKGSEQLATYQAILNIQEADPEHPWKHKIELCGYTVMSKKLDKEITKTCKSCNQTNDSTHKLCEKMIDGKRCNGEFDKTKKFGVRTQFIVDKISEEFGLTVLENNYIVKSCIEQGLFPKNYSACENQFGQPCIYFSKCHGGSDKGLFQLEKDLK